MNIISTPAHPSISHIPQPAEVFSRHPASQLFEFTPKHSSANAVTMEFQLREGMPHDSGSIHGALSCVIDCAARIAAQPFIGACALLEQELHFRSQSTATRFEVTARIDSTMVRYSIYQCSIYALEPQERLLVADAQGTLLERASSAQT